MMPAVDTLSRLRVRQDSDKTWPWLCPHCIMAVRALAGYKLLQGILCVPSHLPCCLTLPDSVSLAGTYIASFQVTVCHTTRSAILGTGTLPPPYFPIIMV